MNFYYYVLFMKKGKIFFVLWVSWSWKSTVMKKLTDEIEGIVYIPSYTTRKPRQWERQWDPYYFISEEEFKKSIDNKEFLEYEYVHGLNYYWTKISNVIDNIDRWKILVKEIDIEWFIHLVDSKKIEWLYKSVFLYIGSEVIRQRLLGRWDKNEEEILVRIHNAEAEIEKWKKYCDLIIDTDKNLDDVISDIKTFLHGMTNCE